jgi:GT2 family glycosyltransferase
MAARARVSVLIPTTGRPELAQACVQGIRDTTQGLDVEIVLAVDHDDRSRELLEPLVEILDYSDDYRGCARAWNDALALCTGDLIVWTGDDVEWEPGWLTAAMDCEAEHPDWLIGLNDGITPPDRATHFLMSRRFIVDVLGGVVAWPEYLHSFHDLEICERARRAGRFVWCEQARLKHIHWLWGSRAQDDTDRRNLGGHPDSERQYALRAAAGFPNNYDPRIVA